MARPFTNPLRGKGSGDKRAAVLFRVKKGWGSLRLKRPKARLSTPVRVKRTASGVETEKIVVAAGETWTWRPEGTSKEARGAECM